MKALIFLFSLFFLLNSCIYNASEDTNDENAQANTENSGQKAGDGVFIHITEAYDDPHRVLMPMKMATMMGKEKDVLLYLDIHAVELVVQGAEDLSMEGFDSFQTYLDQLNEIGVEVIACPTCLQVAGYSPEDLMEGVQVAAKDKFFGFTEGRILTIDY